MTRIHPAPPDTPPAVQLAAARRADRVDGDIENGLPPVAAPDGQERPGLCQRMWRAVNPAACAIISGVIGAGGLTTLAVVYPPARPAVFGVLGLTLLVTGGALAIRDAEAGRGPARNAAAGG